MIHSNHGPSKLWTDHFWVKTNCQLLTSKFIWVIFMSWITILVLLASISLQVKILSSREGTEPTVGTLKWVFIQTISTIKSCWHWLMIMEFIKSTGQTNSDQSLKLSTPSWKTQEFGQFGSIKSILLAKSEPTSPTVLIKLKSIIQPSYLTEEQELTPTLMQSFITLQLMLLST